MEMACVLTYSRVEVFKDYGFLGMLQPFVSWKLRMSCILFESRCLEFVTNSQEIRWTLCLSIGQVHASFEALASAFRICLAAMLMVRGHRFEDSVR